MFHEDHIMPIADLREHDLSPSCWCKPAQDDECKAWIHNSMDEREKYETGERLPS